MNSFYRIRYTTTIHIRSIHQTTTKNVTRFRLDHLQPGDQIVVTPAERFHRYPIRTISRDEHAQIRLTFGEHPEQTLAAPAGHTITVQQPQQAE